MRVRALQARLAVCRDIVLKLWYTALFHVFIWCGRQLFTWASLYAPNNKVTAITFSTSEAYIDRVAEID